MCPPTNTVIAPLTPQREGGSCHKTLWYTGAALELARYHLQQKVVIGMGGDRGPAMTAAAARASTPPRSGANASPRRNFAVPLGTTSKNWPRKQMDSFVTISPRQLLSQGGDNGNGMCGNLQTVTHLTSCAACATTA